MDWFKGKSTGNHGFLPSNIGLSCKISHHQILWYRLTRPSKLWHASFAEPGSSTTPSGRLLSTMLCDTFTAPGRSPQSTWTFLGAAVEWSIFLIVNGQWLGCRAYIYIYWVKLVNHIYNISLTWIKAIWGWFLLLTMIPMRSQWGRYNLPIYIYIYICVYMYINPDKLHGIYVRIVMLYVYQPW